jgi:hypothetical protein
MHLTSTAITIGAGGHLLHGTLPLVGDRIQERLNDEITGTLQLSDVDVRSQLQRRPVAHLAWAVVPKARIEYVMVDSGRHEAPIKRWNNHTRKAQHSAVAVLERCSIEGDVHLPGGLMDTHYTYTRELPAFFALTNARVRVLGADPIEVPLVFANREFVSCLQIGEVFGPDVPALSEPVETIDAISNLVASL